MKMSYTEFNKIISFSKINLSNIFTYYEPIVRFFYSHRDQKEPIYIVDSEELVDSSMISIFERFGISFNSFVGFKKEFILFIDPNNCDFAEQIREQRKYIPDNEVFTKLVVLSDDGNIVQDCYNSVKEIVKGVSYTQFLPSSLTPEQKIKNICNTMGIPIDKSDEYLYDITEYCRQLDSYTYVNQYSYLAYFRDIVDKIVSIIGSRIAVYTGPSRMDPIFSAIALELYLQHNILSYISTENHDFYLSELSMISINPTYLLVEDLVRYVKYLPEAMFSVSPLGLSTYFFKRKLIKLHVRFVPLDNLEPNSVCEKAFLGSDIEIKQIKEFFDIDTVGGCTEIKDFMRPLYKLLDVPIDIFDITKLVFFGMDRVVYVGYLLDFDCDLGALCVSSIGTTDVTLDFNGLKRLFPIDCVIGGLAVTKQLCSKLKISFKANDFKLKVKPRSLAHVVKNSYFDITSKWDAGIIPLSTLGLFVRNDGILRMGLNKLFINTLGVEKCRDSFDCFGGLNPVLVKSITLN